MLTWLSENLATLVILLALVAVVFAIVFSLVRKKKAGKATCSCGCANCPMKDQCH